MSEMNVEREILAAIMFAPDECLYAFELLRPEHFKNGSHADLYEKMLELRYNGHSLDIVTLNEKTNMSDLVLDLSSISYTAANIKSHVNICLDRWYMLQGHQKLTEALQRLQSPERSVASLRTACEDIAYFLSDRVQDKGLQHISEVSASTLRGLNKIGTGKFPGVKTGFKDLDDAGFYLRRKTMSVLAARPGMGKSALALKIAKNSLVNTAVYSLEMANEEQYERLISMETGLSNDDLKDSEILRKSESKILDASEKIDKSKIWINDSATVSCSTIMNQCKRLKAQHDLGLLIVDYLGLIKVEGKFGSRREQVGAISKGLKKVGHELDIPVLALGQLNRSCEDRSDKRPILADLRESGDIEQDAHLVMFIYRGEVYDPQENPGVAEILIRKNRSGRIGTEKLSYEKAETNFKDYEGVSSSAHTNFCKF